MRSRHTGAEAGQENTGSAARVLLAYFSRAGENYYYYYYGGRTTLQVSNTEVLAGMIRDRLACDVFRGQDAVLGVGGPDLRLREVGVHLDLVDRGHDALVLQQLVEVSSS